MKLVIEPGLAAAHYWRDLWRYRELMAFLAWRDVAVRYKQTVDRRRLGADPAGVDDGGRLSRFGAWSGSSQSAVPDVDPRAGRGAAVAVLLHRAGRDVDQPDRQHQPASRRSIFRD